MSQLYVFVYTMFSVFSLIRFPGSILFALVIFPLSCTAEQEREISATNPIHFDQGNLISGRIVKRNFINKAGREYPNIREYYVLTGGQTYFIKLSEGNVTARDLERYPGKSIRMRVRFRNGLWDTDDPGLQSRTGPYIVILSVR